jgi:DNA-directed RNA polymerase specialized sigma24 family protein
VALNEALASRRTDVRLKSSLRGLKWLRQANETWVEVRVENQDAAARVELEIERLPREQQVVVRKRLHEEKTFAEIAGEEGVPLGTVLTRMRLALERLRKMLGDEA